MVDVILKILDKNILIYSPVTKWNNIYSVFGF